MNLLTLNDWHVGHGAKMGEFAGFNMPLYYSKPIDEHHRVRQHVGVFDISHMGQFTLEGPQSEDFLQHAITNDVAPLTEGQALYSPLCREDGGVLDDLIVYKYRPDKWRIIVNAGTREKDFRWMQGLTAKFDVAFKDVSADWCLFAVQGPEAFGLLAPHAASAPGGLRYYHFTETQVFGQPVFMARTGYTGEPGCELAVPRATANAFWQKLTGELGIAPIGLAARDTLRLEAAMALYEHELREEWNALECGLGWAVKLDKPADFVGKAALRKVKEAGLAWRAVGIEVTGRGIPRADYPVVLNGEHIGVVTSGALSPTTGKSIALARVKAAHAKTGTALAVEVRGKSVEAKVVPKPFYQSPKIRA